MTELQMAEEDPCLWFLPGIFNIHFLLQPQMLQFSWDSAGDPPTERATSALNYNVTNRLLTNTPCSCCKLQLQLPSTYHNPDTPYNAASRPEKTESRQNLQQTHIIFGLVCFFPSVSPLLYFERLPLKDNCSDK